MQSHLFDHGARNSVAIVEANDVIDVFTSPRSHSRVRRRSRSTSPHSRLSSLWLLTVLACQLCGAFAYEVELQHRDYHSPLFKRMARQGQISIDRRDPPPLPVRVLEVRQDSSASFPSTITPRSTSVLSQPSFTSTEALSSTINAASSPSQATSSIPTTTDGSNPNNSTATESFLSSSLLPLPSTTIMSLPMPSAFDTSLGSNFTSQACPDFFHSFLNNATFQACTPISLLLQNSNSFFQITRSPVLLSITLERACSNSLSTCSPLMSSLASLLIQDSTCGPDYRKENPLVCQAHAGLVAYEPLFSATCLKNPSTGSYCFTDAITNTSNPSDSYPYYTALGISMPAASRPSCGKCLKDTMTVFAGYAQNRNQPLAGTYIKTAQQIDLGCGPEFANTTVAAGIFFSAAAPAAVLAILDITTTTTLLSICWGILLVMVGWIL